MFYLTCSIADDACCFINRAYDAVAQMGATVQTRFSSTTPHVTIGKAELVWVIRDLAERRAAGGAYGSIGEAELTTNHIGLKNL